MKQNTCLGAEELSAVCYQLSLLLKAGILAEEGVALLVGDAADKSVGRALSTLLDHLREGKTLAAAMEGTGYFPGYLVRMVEIGQAAGRLDQVLAALADYYRRQAETDAAIRRAILYPAMMAILVCVVFLILMSQVLPVFQRVFLQMGVTPSPLAQGLLQVGAAGKYLAGALAILLAVGAVVMLFLSRRRAKAAQAPEAKLLGRGAAGRAVERSRFAGAMALMLQSGLPLDEAADYAAGLLEGTALSVALRDCRAQMEAGVDFPVAAAACGLLDRTQAGLLSAGFRAGSPEKAMEELASRAAAEADEGLSRLLTRMEFILVAVLCLTVGLVLLSVMLPLLGVLSAIG